MARPTKCTKRFRDAYCQAIRDGLSYESAAAEAGVFSESTILDWRARGEAGEEPYATFSRDEKRAVADWERKRLEAMDAAGPNWPREAWKLERRKPDVYGKRERVEHTGADGGPMQVQTIPLPIFGPQDPLNHFDEEPQVETDGEAADDG